LESVKLALSDFKPAFGRQEEIIYKSKKIIILLSKNPAGFNQSIDAVSTYPGNHTVLLVLNDKIPDGRDVSWIWDVDFENLNASHITVSGDRTFDMALRIQYAEKEFETEEALEKALAKAIHNTKENETLFVLATYSGMLEIRKLITGKEIL
jgi:UDP-N-acetylmuramyl tripeptide synthase